MRIPEKIKQAHLVRYIISFPRVYRN
jgi:hypothetical protein